jgi:NADP-dependent aldehyde dehydrogenase
VSSSNFPFGFGVLGHDTATALAAGCPVVANAHPAHPRLSAALAELARRALDEAGAPAGSLGLVGGFVPRTRGESPAGPRAPGSDDRAAH